MNLERKFLQKLGGVCQNFCSASLLQQIEWCCVGCINSFYIYLCICRFTQPNNLAAFFNNKFSFNKVVRELISTLIHFVRAGQCYFTTWVNTCGKLSCSLHVQEITVCHIYYYIENGFFLNFNIGGNV